MQLNLLLISQHLDPGRAIGVCPDGIVHARKVGSQLASALTQKVGQQDAHFVVCQWILRREKQFVPYFRWTWFEERRRHKLVPAIGSRSPRRANTASQDGEKPEGACDLPATQVTRAGCTPCMRRKSSSSMPNLTSDIDND